MKFERILVGIDFSPESEVALGHAAQIASRTGAQLILAHAGTIVDAPDMALAPESAALAEYRRILDDHHAESRARLAEMARDLASRGLRATEVLLDGFADTALIEGAEAVDADLVIIGTHGRTGITRFLIGGVADRVVRLCRRHVMVTRDAGGENGYRRVLVATDFTPLSEKALDVAIALCEPGGVVELLHAWHLPPLSAAREPAPMNDPALQPVRASIEEGAREKLTAMAASWTGTCAPIQISIVNEPPPRAITDRAEAGQHDLIVMGGHGTRGLRRWILGSVAEKTVRHAGCSVFVVHERPPPEDS